MRRLLRGFADRAGTVLLSSHLLREVEKIAVAVVTLVNPHAEHQELRVFFARTVESAGVLLPIVGLLAITSEWSQRTALTTFARVPRRERVIAAKLLAGVALALAAVVLCL